MEYRGKTRKIEFTTILEDEKNASIFRHFKGNEYKILCIAKDCDNLSDLVIYQGTYGDNSIFSRKLDEFFSEMDKEKYPNSECDYRFELINK